MPGSEKRLFLIRRFEGTTVFFFSGEKCNMENARMKDFKRKQDMPSITHT